MYKIVPLLMNDDCYYINIVLPLLQNGPVNPSAHKHK